MHPPGRCGHSQGRIAPASIAWSGTSPKHPPAKTSLVDAAGAAPAGRGFALDPRVSASQDDLQVYYHEVTEIESIECSTSLALTRVSNLDSQLAKLERDASAAALNSDVGAIRKDL